MASSKNSYSDNSFFKIDFETKTLHCRGNWTLKKLMDLKKALSKLDFPDNSPVVNAIDGKNIHQMDSAGALVLQQYVKNVQSNPLSQASLQNVLKNFTAQHLKLIVLINDHETKIQEISSHSLLSPLKPLGFLEKIGLSTIAKLTEFIQFLDFLGEISVNFLKLLFKPAQISWRSMISTIEKTGLYAMPIIALLSFLIGMVLAYQMGMQLKNYGANIYVVDVLGLAILREFSPLMTAIIVAGRSGSAFTAQLGAMKIREEIDALKTLGLSSTNLLIMPKLMGLCLTLPLLTIWSTVFALAGGMMVADSMLNISYASFLGRFYQAISVKAYWTGMLKTPVFGLVIAAIGCFQGLQVFGSAASVGEKTTKSVVQSIFFIIIIDAVFSLAFRWLKI